MKIHVGKSFVKKNYQSPPKAAKKIFEVNKMVENHENFESIYIHNPTPLRGRISPLHATSVFLIYRNFDLCISIRSLFSSEISRKKFKVSLRI